MKKRVFLACVLVIIGLISCAQPPAENGESQASETQETEATSQTAGETMNEATSQTAGETMTITDMTGRTVTVPKEIHRIATPNVDAYRLLVQLRAQDKLVGIPSNMYGSRFSQQDSFEVKVWPEAKQVTKVGGGRPNSEINLEMFLGVEPDIIIYWGNEGETETAARADDLQSKTNIPVICLNLYTKGENLPAIEKAYMLMGKLVDKEERAQELITYFKEQIDEIASITTSVAEEERPGVFIGEISNISAGSLYPPIEYMDLHVVTDKASYGKEVSKEQLIAWDPDIIFLHTATQSHRADITLYLNDPILEGVSAVKNERVYPYKGYFMGWDIATGLVDTVYMAKLTYPELFKDVDVEAKANEILETFYGMPNLFDALVTQSSLHTE